MVGTRPVASRTPWLAALAVAMLATAAGCDGPAPSGPRASSNPPSAVPSAGLASLPPSGPPFPSPIPVPSQAAEPTPSPITGRIAFVRNPSDTSDQTDIWIVVARGGDPKQLTRDPEVEAAPVWLLDGSRLVFAVFDYATNPYYGRLVSTRPDGSDRRDLAPVANYTDALLSPDGRYAAWGGGGEIGGKDGVTLLDRSTGLATLLTTDGDANPVWSPDSRHLLTQEYLLGGVAVVDVPSGHIRRFKETDVETLLGWSTDSTWIVFSGSLSATDTPTWMAPAAGGDVVPFAAPVTVAPITWNSPDGAWSISDRLEIRGAAGGEATRLFPWLSMPTGGPSWAPDSRAVAIACQDAGASDTSSAICVLPIDGGIPLRATDGPRDTSPAWDPAS